MREGGGRGGQVGAGGGGVLRPGSRRAPLSGLGEDAWGYGDVSRVPLPGWGGREGNGTGPRGRQGWGWGPMAGGRGGA